MDNDPPTSPVASPVGTGQDASASMGDGPNPHAATTTDVDFGDASEEEEEQQQKARVWTAQKDGPQAGPTSNSDNGPDATRPTLALQHRPGPQVKKRTRSGAQRRPNTHHSNSPPNHDNEPPGGNFLGRLLPSRTVQLREAGSDTCVIPKSRRQDQSKWLQGHQNGSVPLHLYPTTIQVCTRVVGLFATIHLPVELTLIVSTSPLSPTALAVRYEKLYDLEQVIQMRDVTG